MKASMLPALSALIFCATLTACSETPTETPAAEAASAADSSAAPVGAAEAAADPNAAAMPAGFAVYPAAKMGEAISTPGEAGGGGGMVNFEVAAKPKEVVEFYRQQMQANGMRVTKDGKSGIVHMLSGSNREAATKSISFQISPDGSGTKAQVIYSSQ